MLTGAGAGAATGAGGETGVAGLAAGTGDVAWTGVEGETGEPDSSGVGGPSKSPKRARTLSSVNSAMLEVLIWTLLALNKAAMAFPCTRARARRRPLMKEEEEGIQSREDKDRIDDDRGGD